MVQDPQGIECLLLPPPPRVKSPVRIDDNLLALYPPLGQIYRGQLVESSNIAQYVHVDEVVEKTAGPMWGKVRGVTRYHPV